MPFVANTTKGPIGLSPGHMIPENGSLEIPEDVLEALGQLPSNIARFQSGDLTVASADPIAEAAAKAAAEADAAKAAAKK